VPVIVLLAIFVFTGYVWLRPHRQALQTDLTGAGSTFAFPLYSTWAAAYAQQHPGAQINYQSIGSGGGIRQVSIGTVDFGGTDSPMSDRQLAEAREHLGGATVYHFPVALGADVPIYNVPGLNAEIHFPAAALAGIYLGTVTRWNDPLLTAANPGVALPDAHIIVCHRSDGSGTTFIWVDFLGKVSAAWRQQVGVGASVRWPVGIGGKGNEGVAGFVRQTPYSIGYVELVFAAQNHMSYGSVQNAAGQFVRADLASVTAAAAGAAANMPADFRVSITNAPGEGAYPISSFTWMLVPGAVRGDAESRARGRALKDFLTWGLTQGQALTPQLTYAPVAPPVIARELAVLNALPY
jgi:phosphate transport system substrate-binding protein